MTHACENITFLQLLLHAVKTCQHEYSFTMYHGSHFSGLKFPHFYTCLSVILFTVATEVGGAHPAGMHTCLMFFIN